MSGRLAIAILCYFAAGISAQSDRWKAPVVQQIDHILAESSDPAALFSFFSETLQLPIAWPLAENQGYISGGIGLGNVSLEIFRYRQEKESPRPKTPLARFSGLALQPVPLNNAFRQLQAREVPFDVPQSTRSRLPNGSEGIAWTTVALPSYSRPGMSIFLYEYNPAYLRVEIRRQQWANRLALNRGGPLGFVSASEVVITTSQYKKDLELWSLLLGPPAENGKWNLGQGPAIRLEQGTKDGIGEILLTVRSLSDAASFLKKSRLIGSSSANRITIRPTAAQALRVALQQNPKPGK